MRPPRSITEVPEKISKVKVWTGIGSKFRPETGRNWRVLIRARSAGIAARNRGVRETTETHRFPKSPFRAATSSKLGAETGKTNSATWRNRFSVRQCVLLTSWRREREKMKRFASETAFRFEIDGIGIPSFWAGPISGPTPGRSVYKPNREWNLGSRRKMGVF